MIVLDLDRGISAIDVADLEWYLGEGQTLFFRSTFGYALEKAQSRHFDSEDNVIRSDYDRWQTMSVKSDVDRNYAVTYDDAHLIRYARISRLLDQVGRVSNALRAVLESYYGDSGSRWGRHKEGRIASVYKLAPLWRNRLKADKAKSFVTVSDDDRIENYIVIKAVSNDSDLHATYTVGREQAYRLLHNAHKEWRRATKA